MSVIKVNSIQNTSTANGGISIDTSGHVTVDNVQMPAAGALSNRNFIINGGMICSQRATTFASGASGGGRYTTDRWNVPLRTRAAQSTDAPAGFAYSLLIDREQTGGTEPFTVSTGIEVQDITQTGSYTLSFYAKSADVTALNINVQDRTGVSEAGTSHSSIVSNQAVTINNTWTRYTHTFTITSVSFTGTCLRVSIGNTSAAQNDEALITGVQLEVGSKATPFEHRSFGDELLRCSRYFVSANWQFCAKISSLGYRHKPPGPGVAQRTAADVSYFHPVTGTANQCREHSSGTAYSINDSGNMLSGAAGTTNYFGTSSSPTYDVHVKTHYDAEL